MSAADQLVIIGCSHSAGEALQSLSASGYCLPAGVSFFALPCGAALDALQILRALEAGAERVLVLSCFADACRSYHGNLWAEKRTANVRELLQEAGLNPDRAIYKQVSPTMSTDLAQWITTLLQPETRETDVQAPS